VVKIIFIAGAKFPNIVFGHLLGIFGDARTQYFLFP